MYTHQEMQGCVLCLLCITETKSFEARLCLTIWRSPNLVDGLWSIFNTSLLVKVDLFHVEFHSGVIVCYVWNAETSPCP